MHNGIARLGIAALMVAGLASRADAQGLKPYVVLVLDTSGSMNTATGAGPTSCGSSDTRLNHARCAINQIANSVGDMVFAFGMFRMNVTGTYTNNCAANCNLLGADVSGGINCQDAGNDDDHFQLLTALVDGNNHDAATWTDFTCNTCSTAIAQNPEIFEPSGNTPVAGSLLGARRYWQGLQATNGTVILPMGDPGFDPIRTDEFRDEFLPSGEQCRPYITIMLTDGDETCGGNPPAAATALFTTPVDANNYTIYTRVIGFGQTPPDTQIEALAVAGQGGVDPPGTDGFYAQSEQDLSIAISQIIADSIRFERCNDLDDDCDDDTDEDFPSLGTACDDGLLGVCRGTGTFVCRADETGTECLIDTPGASPSPEVCNNLDDNCNGAVDEGLMCGGCGEVELCDNMDNDCDGPIDEGLSRPCGTDVGECTAGTEVCVAGVWQGCDATGPFAEQCNGLDDDCDGVCDGFARPCTALPPPGNPNVGPCHDGTEVCPALCSTSGNTFEPCLGEVVPTSEVCNCIDDDCDGTADDGTGGADCSTTCGLGTTTCNPMTCALQCQSTTQPDDDTCNNIDDDCDMLIDEDAPPGGPCDEGGTLCNGQLICMSGNYVCVGDQITTETCDCRDNDCDGTVDNDNGNCQAGSTCTDGPICECAFPCANDEFPCPQGRICVDDLCVTDPCFQFPCGPAPNGNAQSCSDIDMDGDGDCVETCTIAQCLPGQACHFPTGECRPDNCLGFPERCTDDQLCNNGVCVADPCAGVSCPTGQYCTEGACYQTCVDVECPDGQRCDHGLCEPDPCGEPCEPGYVCQESTGECVVDPCNATGCPQGQACDSQTGECVQDPCLGVTCPELGQVCDFGTCYGPDHFQPDAQGPPELVTTGGGGCSSSGGGGGGGGVLVAFALLALRRRSRS
jgi:hypothetical protein